MSKSTREPKKIPVETIPWEEWLELFLLHRKAQGLSERTLKDYQYHVSLFFNKYESGLTLGSLKLFVIKYFAESGELSPYTFNTRRKTLKPFFNWAIEEGLIENHPMTGIKKRKEDEKPKSVNEEVLKYLLSLPDTKTYVGLRDYAVFLLTMDSGIRPSEVFGLKVQDVNIKSLEVNIPASVSKTRVSRTLPISPITAEVIRKLILNRHPSWREDTPLFSNENGGKVISRTWGRRMEYYSKLLGTKVKPYQLRHSFAIMFLRSGGNAFSLQRTLGHTNLTMTKRYVSITESDLYQQHALATPLNKLVPQRNRVRKL